MSVTYKHETPYWGKVTKQQLGKSKGGHAQIVITFQVLGEINPMDPEGELIRSPSFERTMYRVITEKTADFAWEDIEALCDAAKLTPYPEQFRQLDPDNQAFSYDLTGAELAFYCKHDTYEGKTNEKWSISRGGPKVEAMDEKELRQLDTLFGRKRAAGPAKAAAKAPPRRTKTEAGMAAQAPLTAPGDDGPDPWDKDDAKAKEANAKLAEASADDIPF